MDITRAYAYRYYEKVLGPMACLSKLPLEEAVVYQHKFHTEYEDRVYYMEQRRFIEQIMYRSFKAKGGRPENKYAYYFTVNIKERLRDYFHDAERLAIPISKFNKETISFTYCDSFLTYSRRDGHPTRRKLFTYDEIEDVVNHYGDSFDRGDYMALIEMQLWSDEPLRTFCIEHHLPIV